MSTLPNGWTMTKISQIADYVQRGKSPKYTVFSELPVINQKCIRWFGIQEENLKYVDPVQWTAWSEERFLRNGDILWNSTGTGTIGRAAVYRGLETSSRAVADSHVTIVRANGAITPDFLHRFIQSPAVQSKIDDMQAGSTNQVELGKEAVLTTELPLPPLPEQKRIVAKIDSLSGKSKRARDHLDHIPRLVEKYKQAVLAAAFRGDLTQEWRDKRKLSNTIKATSFDEVLTDIRYGTAKKCSYRGGDTPVLRIPNVQGGEISLDDLKSADFKDSEIEKLQLLSGDILVIRSNGSLGLVGRGAIVDDACSGMLFAGYLIRLRLDASRAMPEYVHLWLQSSNSRAAIEQQAKSTSGVNNINSTQIGQLAIQLASIEEQVEIVRIVKKAFSWIDRLALEATSASNLISNLDQAILAKAFRGELVPQDLDDEPATKLLERIASERAAKPKAKRGRARTA